jgi:hypothetical protein
MDGLLKQASRVTPRLSPRWDDKAWRRLAICAWAVVVVVVCARVTLQPRRNTVYPIFAHGARNWIAGHNLYTPENQLPGFDHFVYPPPTALLYAPWAFLPDAVGGIFWRLTGLAIYLAAFLWFCRTIVPRSTAHGTLGILLLLLLPHSIDSFNNGQSNLLIAGLLMGGVTAALRERWNLAAGCLALPALIKIHPLAVGLLAAVAFPRKLAPRLAVALLLGLAAPLVCQHPAYVLEQYRQYVAWVSVQDRTLWPMHNAPHDFYFLTRWLNVPLQRGVYTAVQFAAAALCALMCWRLARRHNGGGHDDNHGEGDALLSETRLTHRATLARRILGLGVGWIIAFGPATESSTFALLAPVLAIETYVAWTSPGVGARLSVSVVYVLLCLSGMALWFPGGRRVAQVLQPLAGIIHFSLQIRLCMGAPPRGTAVIEEVSRHHNIWLPHSQDARRTKMREY